MVKKKLIILGNGFDLACGLKSRYYDFFSSRLNEDLISDLDYAMSYFKDNMYNNNVWFKTLFGRREKNRPYVKIGERKICYETGQVHRIYETVQNSHLNFWDFVFYFSKYRSDSKDFSDYDWCDVEKRMLEFLQTPEELKEVPSFNRFDSVGTLLCLHLAYYLPREISVDNNKDIIEYLYEELRNFEREFCKYIVALSDDADYRKKAVEKIYNISLKPIDKIDDKIFSFNYTDPFSEEGFDVISVHGKAKTESILFGVDQEKILPNAKTFRFTKTFRQMTETKLSKNYSKSILPDKDEVNVIAFFGHSLSEFDYSYFQTIFDHYDLYNSSVSLVFYYQTYGERSSEDMEFELAANISKMLYDYSPSIDNEKKGRNLMHKLLLEKRLIMSELDDFYIAE
ncbi:AbiH family protein [Enterococcus casseliflavus]|uniref:AbiH family protein n=1 Tax=Enterococcus casseliflavus TaxID=37734 RepID=UPI0018AC4E08|nr:AbiH family protein [Enterococcus casseliflavus]